MVKAAKVVIIGGGFGGLNAAKGLGKKVPEVVIVDKTNHHLFQPLLYQVASAALSPGQIAAPIREAVAKQKNAVVIMGEVLKIEKGARLLHMANGDRIKYDYLVVAPGARHSYFGHDEWEGLAPGIKTLNDALSIRERILQSFEKAERSDSISEAEKYLNFVVIGAGPTGVEMAGAIAEIAYKTMIRNFRRINTEKTKIFLVEGAPQVLPTYPKKLGDHAKRDLEKMGVQVLTETMVTNITCEGVQLGEHFIPATNVIWAAGNQASPLLKSLDVPLDKQGRVMVNPDLSIPGHPEIFVIGDAAHAKGVDGKPLPGIAPTAIQQGKYVAKIIKNRTPPDKRPPFRYLDKGMMATIGTNKAVAMIGHWHMTGYLAWLAWGFIHILYLIGFRNRALVMIGWVFQYFTGQRGARLIRGTLDEDDTRPPCGAA
ncbi:MAG: NAD(P)/FAD-dependent oxidoreductase [Parachlamydiales bacterium]